MDERLATTLNVALVVLDHALVGVELALVLEEAALVGGHLGLIAVARRGAGAGAGAVLVLVVLLVLLVALVVLAVTRRRRIAVTRARTGTGTAAAVVVTVTAVALLVAVLLLVVGNSDTDGRGDATGSESAHGELLPVDATVLGRGGARGAVGTPSLLGIVLLLVGVNAAADRSGRKGTTNADGYLLASRPLVVVVLGRSGGLGGLVLVVVVVLVLVVRVDTGRSERSTTQSRTDLLACAPSLILSLTRQCSNTHADDQKV
jgi:uncharacterized membrane protein